jgi:lysozyme
MNATAKLEAKRNLFARKRRRQIALFEATRRKGHARKAAEYGRRVRKLNALLQEAPQKPNWKLLYAARFIAPWEGLLTTAYRDTGGILTIGYGHTGPDVFEGQTITKAKALALLASDLRTAARAVARNVHVPLSTRQRIAAISFTFNVGEGGLQSSTFLRELNARNYRAAADALLLWVRDANGTVLLGLQRRRRMERWLFLNPRKES